MGRKLRHRPVGRNLAEGTEIRLEEPGNRQAREGRDPDHRGDPRGEIGAKGGQSLQAGADSRAGDSRVVVEVEMRLEEQGSRREGRDPDHKRVLDREVLVPVMPCRLV